MKFQPSGYSYGYGQAEIEDDVAEEAAEVAQESAPGDLTGYVGLVGTGLSTLLGTGKTERESLAVKKGRLENYRAQKKKAKNINIFGIPAPGSKGWYANEIRKLEYEIQAMEEQAGEERTSATLYTVGRIGVTLGIFAGAGILVMFGVNQLQKARLQQAQLEQLRGGSA